MRASLRSSLRPSPGLVGLLGILALAAPSAEAKLAELLITEDQGASRLAPVELTAAVVDAAVELTSMRVTYDLTFTSRRAAATEGTFYFALPTTAYVHEFGMWIDGYYQGAAVVEAKAGRVAYEAIVRRGIDPALLEWSAGSTFKMRVYPLVAGKPTRVVLTVGMPLEPRDGKLRGAIPLDFGKVAALKVSVHGRVYGDDPPSLLGWKPLVARGGEEDDDRLEFTAAADAKDVLPPPEVVFSAPVPDAATAKVRREEGDRHYVDVVAFPDLPGEDRPAPARAVIVWDYSLSGEELRDARLAALRRYLDARKPPRVDVWGFNQQVFPVAAGLKGAAAVVAAVARLPHDGGTRIDHVTAKLPELLKGSGEEATDLLLVTDGVDSFELFDLKKVRRAGGPGLNAFLLAPGTGANAAVLGRLAADLDAVVVDHDATPSRAAFTRRPWRVAAVRGDARLKELVTDSDVVFPGDGVRVRGHARTLGDAKIELDLVQGDRKKRVTWKLDLDAADRSETGTLARLWAQRRITGLLAAKRANAPQVRALALEHQLMSPYTVMVVLESCEDFKEFDLPAPKGCRPRPRFEEVMAAEGGDGEEEAAEDAVEDAVEEELAEAADADEGGDIAAPGAVAQGDRGGDVTTGAIDFDAADIGGQRKAPMGDLVGESPAPAPAAAPYDAAGDVAFGYEDGSDDLGAAGDEEEDLDEIVSEMDGDDGEAPERDSPPLELGFEGPLTVAAAKGVDALYAAYLKQRPVFRRMPVFYREVARRLATLRRPDLADLVLSNVVELRPGDARWLRLYAYQLVAWGEAAKAVPLYRAVTELRGEDPQSFRDFGVALEAVGHPGLALAQFERVHLGKWDERLDGIHKVVRRDLARVAAKVLATPGQPAALVAKARQYVGGGGGAAPFADDKLVVTVTWDTDDTDVDLHVVEPGGSHVYYGNKAPPGAVGSLAWDATGGFGPEQYRARAPQRGVGSSRVDLQACKLEYSIVSPK